MPLPARTSSSATTLLSPPCLSFSSSPIDQVRLAASADSIKIPFSWRALPRQKDAGVASLLFGRPPLSAHQPICGGGSVPPPTTRPKRGRPVCPISQAGSRHQKLSASSDGDLIGSITAGRPPRRRRARGRRPKGVTGRADEKRLQQRRQGAGWRRGRSSSARGWVATRGKGTESSGGPARR
jgi:hypothetical protein